MHKRNQINKSIDSVCVCFFSFTVNWFRFFFLFKLLWILLFALFYLFHASKATCQSDYVCEHDALFGDCCNNSIFCVSIAGVWEYQILTFFSLLIDFWSLKSTRMMHCLQFKSRDVSIKKSRKNVIIKKRNEKNALQK